MNKREFMKSLERELSLLNTSDRAKALMYYDELFEDGLEMGQSEEQTAYRLGSPKLVAEDVLAECLKSSNLKTGFKNKKYEKSDDDYDRRDKYDDDYRDDRRDDRREERREERYGKYQIKEFDDDRPIVGASKKTSGYSKNYDRRDDRRDERREYDDRDRYRGRDTTGTRYTRDWDDDDRRYEDRNTRGSNIVGASNNSRYGGNNNTSSSSKSLQWVLSPILIVLAVVGFALFIAVMAVLFSLLMTFFALALSFIVVGPIMAIASIPIGLMYGSLVYAAIILGSGLVLLGLGILFWAFAKVIVKVTGMFLKWTGTMFHPKRKEAR